MEIEALFWLGTRTAKFDEMVAFTRDVLGLSTTMEEPGMAFFELPNGDQFEVFGPDYHGGGHPASGVAAAFKVADATAARDELEAAGVEVSKLRSLFGYSWAYFTAPDDNAYLILSGGPAEEPA